jgi:hypothetical protein
MNTRAQPNTNSYLYTTPKITKVKIIIDHDNEINHESEENINNTDEKAKIVNYFLNTPEKFIPSRSQQGSKKEENSTNAFNKVFNISKTNNKDGKFP